MIEVFILIQVMNFPHEQNLKGYFINFFKNYLINLIIFKIKM